MVNGTYTISMSTPLGMKTGTLILTEENGILTGSIRALGKNNPITNGKYNKNEFEFSGTLNTMLSKIKYTAKGTINGDTLQATADTKYGVMNINGSRV